jgi:4-carboxymuconolactone decarboxylase
MAQHWSIPMSGADGNVDGNTQAFDRGLALRRDMFGPAGADKAIESASDFSKPLQEMVTRFCFGEVWQRPGLDRKTRSLLTLSMLIGSGRFAQFPAHVRGALANGVTKDELRELVLHAQLYCGIPSAVEATALCESVLGS